MKKQLLLIVFITMLPAMILHASVFASGPFQQERSTGNNFGITPEELPQDTREIKPFNMKDIPVMGALLVPNSSNETVMAFDPVTGDLVDEFFFPENSEHLTTPLYVIWDHDGTNLLVSDQVESLVQQFDTEGNFLGTFAPSGGHDPDILTNIRAILLKEDGNLLVCVGGGDNAHALAEFDTEGNYLGNFVENNAGGLDRPFGLIYREDFDDYLVAANGSNGVHRYDADGEFVEMFVTGLGFPQQINRASNGNILVANHTTPVGVVEYDPSGEEIEQYDVVGGLRGVHELNYGELMVTTPSGVFVINRDNQFIEQKAAGNSRHITYIRPTDIDYYPLHLDMDPPMAGEVIDESGNFGEYPEGHTITLTASSNIFHEFEYWTDQHGEVLSTETTFDYQMPAEAMTLTANYAVLDIHEVTFQVKEDSEEAAPIADALVDVEGFDPVSTNEDGEVSLDLPVGTFTANIWKQGYEEVSMSFSVTNSDMTIEVKLVDDVMPPPYFTVHTEDYEPGEALLTWLNPGLFYEYRYDSGVVDSNLGFQAGNLNSVMGAVHRHEARLKEITWHIEDDGPQTVKLWVLGLDENGLPDRDDVLYVAEGVQNTEDGWNSYLLDEAVVAPDGFFIGLSANEFLGLSVDAGEDETWSFTPETQYGIFNITDPQAQFTPIEDWGFLVNFMLRAYGENHGELSFEPLKAMEAGEPSPKRVPVDKPYKPEPLHRFDGSQKAYLGVNVFLNDMDTPIASGLTDTEYFLSDVPAGTNLAGVQSLYTTGTSEITAVEFEMESGEPIVLPLPFADDFEGYNDHEDFVAESDWTMIDANDDGHNWYHHYDSWDDIHVMASRSYDPDEEAELSPENYLILPGLEIPALEEGEDSIKLTYTIAASGSEAFQENYKVVASTTGNELDDFVEAPVLFEETLTEDEAVWNFAERTIDLSDYQNQDIHLAFVHYDCVGQDRLLLREVDVQVVQPEETGLYELTFKVDMSEAGEFDYQTHEVYLSGNFGDELDWVEPGTNDDFTLERISGSLIYSLTLELEPGEYVYKYFSDAYGQGFAGAEWPDELSDRVILLEEDTETAETWGVHPDEVSADALTDTGVELQVFPNPVKTKLHLISDEIIDHVELLTMTGQTVYAAAVATNNHGIGVQALSEGFYFVKVLTANGMTVRKIQIIE